MNAIYLHLRKRLTKKQKQENGRRLREENERVRREMTRKALYGAEYQASKPKHSPLPTGDVIR